MNGENCLYEFSKYNDNYFSKYDSTSTASTTRESNKHSRNKFPMEVNKQSSKNFNKVKMLNAKMLIC